MSKYPHNAGTEGDERLASWMEDMWKKNGLDNVKRYWYNVLLSFPDTESPNTVSLIDSSGKPFEDFGDFI